MNIGSAESNNLKPAPSRKAVLVLPVLQFVAIVAAGVSLLNELAKLDPNTCLNVPVSTPGLKFVAAALLGLLLGRYSGAIRYFSTHDSEPATDRDHASVLLGRAALSLILFALIPIFVYEAVGVYQPVSGYEPITYYVRCSIWIDNNLAGGIRTMVILAVIGFLFGQWLWAWHPSEPGRADPRARTEPVRQALENGTRAEPQPDLEPIHESRGPSRVA